MLARMRWEGIKSALSGERLPAALVDLDALDRNVDRLVRALGETDKTLRVASKSVRHVGLLRHILERGGARVRGLLCFTLEEACFLHDQGFDDLVVAYPSVQRAALEQVADRVCRGASIRLMADHRAHLEAYGAAGRDAGCTIEALIDLDVSYEALRGRVHLGVLRSPIRSAKQAADLARAASRIGGLRIVGLMGYEAHVAGLTDDNPFSRSLTPVRRAIKRISIPRVATLRAEAVAALRSEGVEVAIVNGGGTGSVRTTAREACVTEVTAGSGFLCSHLFDYYDDNVCEPAAFFALEVARIPEPGVITCLGGGYIASGEPGWDRLPVPYLPEGLRYVSMEGAGEVQTPLRGRSHTPIYIGDPILFRHAKAGELAERFDRYLLLRDGSIVAREPTYRGMGRCFL